MLSDVSLGIWGKPHSHKGSMNGPPVHRQDHTIRQNEALHAGMFLKGICEPQHMCKPAAFRLFATAAYGHGPTCKMQAIKGQSILYCMNICAIFM